MVAALVSVGSRYPAVLVMHVNATMQQHVYMARNAEHKPLSQQKVALGVVQRPGQRLVKLALGLTDSVS